MEVVYLSDILSIQRIRKRFKKNIVLDDISFNVPRGSIFAFLGLNGAGKSTLLNIVIQLLLPTSGKVVSNDCPILKNKVGVVFQENTFDDELTIYENMFIRGRLYNLSKKYLQKKIEEISFELELNPYLHKKYKLCSGGQKRLAMIARALISEPEIIIMDEPTVALDVEIRKKVWTYLLKLNKEKNVTIFFSSHYIEEASLANNLSIIKSGKIVFTGTYKELIEKYSKKKLNVNLGDDVITKEISSVKNSLIYLNCLDINKIKTFSLENSSLEEVFLKIVHNENSCI